ncbi:MAG: SIS domain-containing protein [Bacillota bacterium]
MNGIEYLSSLSIVLNNTVVQAYNRDNLDFNQAIDRSIETLLQLNETNNKIMFIGNGGSAGIASHCAIDYWKNGGIRATCFNEGALLTCISNDYGYEEVFRKPIEMFADSGDLLVAISSSGQSKNILNGVEAAKEKGCEVITLSGFSEDNPLRKMGDLNFYVPSNSYGFVELAHQVILHAILDLIMERNNK